MRVITGIAKKKPLLTLKDLSLRPTTGRVKEAMFSIIQFKIKDSVVLDLFSGSGQLGIEALSRGAKNCTFVDCSLKAHKVQIMNLKSTKLEKKAKVILKDSVDFLKTTKINYDIIFLDPPYKTDLLEKTLNLAFLKLTANGIIICEHLKNLKLPFSFEDFALQKQYSYGKIGLTVFEKNEVEI